MLFPWLILISYASALRFTGTRNNQRLNEIASLTLGVGGILTLLINRVCIEDVTSYQARSDIISTMACSAVLLDAVSKIPTPVRRKPSVEQVGENDDSAASADGRTAWLWKAIRNCSEDASTLTIVNCNSSTVTLGVGPTRSFDMADRPRCSILDEPQASSREVYLPDLQARPARNSQSVHSIIHNMLLTVQILPAKGEFEALLPRTCQAVLILPAAPPLPPTDQPADTVDHTRPSAVIIGFRRSKTLQFGQLKMIRSLVRIYYSLYSRFHAQ
jgi:hypothetical protein